MPSTGQTVPTSPTDHVTFTTDDLAGMKVHDVGANFRDLADEFVSDNHGDGDCLLCPIVPLIDMDVCPTDSRPVNLDQDIIDSDGRLGDVFEPEAGFRFTFDKSFHFETRFCVVKSAVRVGILEHSVDFLLGGAP
jgi:hypothetical protein